MLVPPAPPPAPYGQNDSHRSYGRHCGPDGSPGHPMVLMASRVRRKNVTPLTPILNLIKGNILPLYIRGHQHHRMSRRAIGSTVATIGVFELLSWFPNQSGNQICSSVRHMQSGKPVGAIFSFIQGLINDIFMVLSSLSSISFSVSDPSTRVLLSVWKNKSCKVKALAEEQRMEAKLQNDTEIAKSKPLTTDPQQRRWVLASHWPIHS